MPGPNAREMMSDSQQRWALNDHCQAIFATALKKLDPELYTLYMANPRCHEGSGYLLGYDGQARVHRYNVKALEFESSRKITENKNN